MGLFSGPRLHPDAQGGEPWDRDGHHILANQKGVTSAHDGAAGPDNSHDIRQWQELRVRRAVDEACRFPGDCPTGEEGNTR